MNKEKRYALKTRATKIIDTAYDRIEEIVLNDKSRNDVVMGRIAGVLSDASNRIDYAIDTIGRGD